MRATTVHEYLCEYIAARQITDPSRWVTTELAERIALVASYADTDRLRPIYDALHGRIGYEAIKIVVACEKNRNEEPLCGPSREDHPHVP